MNDPSRQSPGTPPSSEQALVEVLRHKNPEEYADFFQRTRQRSEEFLLRTNFLKTIIPSADLNWFGVECDKLRTVLEALSTYPATYTESAGQLAHLRIMVLNLEAYTRKQLKIGG